MVRLAVATRGNMSFGLGNSVSVAFFAHVGGFIAGMVLAVAYQLVIGETVISRRNGLFPQWWKESVGLLGSSWQR
ncbi:MAG: hypothetical protein CM1200mP22_33300 [Dehalococcoidia bacterium]|nr:MAG: hypothetical protein CM1200mP22_33300 [Dehalococcoidia bacterium]